MQNRKLVTNSATSHAEVMTRRTYTAVWKREGGAMWRYRQRMESFVKATLRRPNKFEAMTSLRALVTVEGDWMSQICLSRIYHQLRWTVEMHTIRRETNTNRL